MPQQHTESYDLCVIGCGSGGFSAAVRGLDLGKRVCIVEGDQIGGAGVMWGALASKTMWELAKDYAVASKVDRGYRSSALAVDYPAVRSAVLEAVKEKQYQMLSQVETYSERRWNGPGSLTLKPGRGGFTPSGDLEVRLKDGRTENVRADYYLIATGSKPRRFPHIETDQKQVIDSDGLLNLTSFPKRLMIIGAGIIGCEFATIFSNYRQTKVYLADHKDRIIPFEDRDVSDFVSDNLSRSGVEILHSAILKDIVRQDGNLRVVLDFEDNHSEVVEVDTVLISIGRRPYLDGLNLEALGVEPNAWGMIDTDADCRVRDNIYAAGDVTHHPALVNMAEMEARYAVEHMFGLKPPPMKYKNMSTVMFFYPEVAAVGMNEKSCQRKEIPYRAAHYANAFLTRAIAMRSVNGFMKIIVSDDADQRILGMRAAGPEVSSAIMSIAHLMDHEKGIRDILKSVYPHPTISEGIQECLRMLLGESVYKPRAFPRRLSIRAWNPVDGYSDR